MSQSGGGNGGNAKQTRQCLQSWVVRHHVCRKLCAITDVGNQKF